MDLFENRYVTYDFSLEIINEKIKTLRHKLTRLENKVMSVDQSVESLYLTLLYDDIYLTNEEITRLKKLKKDKYLEICN